MLSTDSHVILMKENNKGRPIFNSFYIFSTVFVLLITFIVVYFQHSEEAPLDESLIIVIPGGGLTEKGDIPRHTQLRIDKAIELFNAHKDSNPKIITLSAGTPHKPNPLDNQGFPILEASAAAKVLSLNGIPKDRILEEALSLDTIGNAYFLRTIHIDPGNYRNIIVITNNWHFDRTKAMFNKVFALPKSKSNRRRMLGPQLRYNITYMKVDSGLEPEIFLKRKERERKSLETFLDVTRKKFYDLKELHDFIFIEHTAYASYRLLQPRANQLDKETLKSY